MVKTTGHTQDGDGYPIAQIEKHEIQLQGHTALVYPHFDSDGQVLPQRFGVSVRTGTDSVALIIEATNLDVACQMVESAINTAPLTGGKQGFCLALGFDHDAHMASERAFLDEAGVSVDANGQLQIG
jgi:hypothetical protein